MEIKVAISPCPNDTFIFGALANQLIDSENFTFKFDYYDINDLNELSKKDEYDLIKMSYYHYLKFNPNYFALPCGGALGHNCGPLLISKTGNIADLHKDAIIAIPGKNTTANFLLRFYNSALKNVKVIRFDNIENAVLENTVDAGLIIHENRFTYQDKGLKKIVDLGEYWETKTRSPIPLGCLAISKKFESHAHQTFTNLIQKSIGFAYTHFDLLFPFIKYHAQEMDQEVIKAHIALYVNEYSMDIQESGRSAIDKMEKEIKNQHY